MRKFFALALLLLALASAPAVARPNDPGDGREGLLDRFVRLVTSFLQIETKDDLPRPPLP